MYNYYGGYNNSLSSELKSDLWIQRHVPGGLNSNLGERLDNVMGGNPNPTYGQIYGGAPGVNGHHSYGNNYGYGYSYGW